MQRILVIDDDVLTRDYVVACLQNLYEVVGAPNGEKGLILAELLPPDLIICDITMPGMDGFQVLQRMQEQMRARDVPFIFLTALDGHSQFRQGMQLGADDYLTKPISINELLRAVDTQLTKKVRRDQRILNVMEQLRTNITTSLPHELRTAILIIEGYAQLALEDQEKDAAIQTDMLRSIRDNAERLHLLSEKFLWYVRTHIGRHEHPPHSKTHNIHKVIQAIANEEAERKGRADDLFVVLEPSHVSMHEEYLKEMMREVVENAFKFSEAGTPVTVTGNVEFDVYKIIVADRGRGMTGAQIAQVGGFMQFERGRFEQQGTGLGLVIAKRIVETVGGRMKIESAGKQTKVSFTLPCPS